MAPVYSILSSIGRLASTVASARTGRLAAFCDACAELLSASTNDVGRVRCLAQTANAEPVPLAKLSCALNEHV